MEIGVLTADSVNVAVLPEGLLAGDGLACDWLTGDVLVVDWLAGGVLVDDW